MKTTCGKCGSERTMYGGRLRCKPCMQKQQAAYYAKNKDTVRLKATQRLYGVTADEALALRAKDGCDVCGENRIGQSLHIDHDHETGKVRGVLCHGCNLALGNVEDSPARLRALADYLERNQ